jgi:hypothetical protein
MAYKLEVDVEKVYVSIKIEMFITIEIQQLLVWPSRLRYGM